MSSLSQRSLVPQVITLLGAAFDDKYAPCFRMAGAIISQTQKNGCCSPQDLLVQGYSTADLETLWHMANAVAGVELRLIEGTSFHSERGVRYA